MRLHLDTSFLIDWYDHDSRIGSLSEEILVGAHRISVDPIVQTEYFAAQRISRDKRLLFELVVRMGAWIPLSSNACELASTWLAPMSEAMRRAHFADALIAAIATVEGATLVTGDRRIARVLPIVTQEY